MKEQLKRKLNFIIKEKLVNELGLNEEQENRLKNNTKEYIIQFILDNDLISADRINELYCSYKDSSNSVLYLLESNVKEFDYSLIDEGKVNKAIDITNKINNEEKISDFALENCSVNEEYILLEFTYKKSTNVIFGGDPKINGYKLGDIIELKVLKDASIFHFKKFNKFIVKCNDWAAIKSIKNIITNVFLCTVYHPKFNKEIIDKITINPDGKNHIIKASYQNQNKNNSQPALLSISDEALTSVEIYNELEGNFNYKKTYNCFRVDINSRPRFVGISNLKGKMWIPSILHKDELNQYAKGILERINLSLGELQKSPEKYIRFHNDYCLDKNIAIDNILKTISEMAVSDKKSIQSNEFIYNALRFGKGKFFKVLLNPYFCEEHQTITELNCINDSEHHLQIITDNSKNNKGRIFVKCKECNYKYELLEFVSLIKTECCNSYLEINNYSDIIVVLPTKITIQKINEFLQLLNYAGYLIDFFYITNGQIEFKRNVKPKKFKTISYFKPFMKVIQSSINEELHKELNKITERCLRTNPTETFCKECYDGKDWTSLEGIDSIKNMLRDKNKIRICLPRLFGYIANVYFDGIHNGYEGADLKFLYNENDGNILEFSNDVGKDFKKVGIHIKSPEKNDPKNCNNPKITSALGHIVTSRFKRDFDVIGFAMPNNLNEEIISEFEFMCNGLGVDLLIIDKNDWLKIFSYYKEQKIFDNLYK